MARTANGISGVADRVWLMCGDAMVVKRSLFWPDLSGGWDTAMLSPPRINVLIRRR
ncbi:MAG: hypothetical protein ING37_04740 [Rhodocyclaceae bacterium]|nr:hypothetical protein [Rhodocyclaceae bacterium]